MMDRLQHMLDMQRVLQHRINGYDLEDQHPELRNKNLMLNVFCVSDELHEMMNEVGWKPWATSTHLNREAAQRELVDAWHFFMNLMLHLDMTAADLHRLYVAKNAINHQRQDEGYDGVTGKCPACHRDLAEVDVNEVVADKGLMPRVDLHCQCGHYIGSRPV